MPSSAGMWRRRAGVSSLRSASIRVLRPWTCRPYLERASGPDVTAARPNIGQQTQAATAQLLRLASLCVCCCAHRASNDHRLVAPGGRMTSTTTGPQVAGTAGTAKEQAAQVAGTTASAAGDVAGTAKEQAANVVGEAVTQTQNLLGQASEQVNSQATEQTQRLSQNIRQLAQHFSQTAGAGAPGSTAHSLVQTAAQPADRAAGYLD